MIESVVKTRDNSELIVQAFRLWLRDPHAAVVLDATYGKGNFYLQYRPPNLIAHDITIDGVDFRDLPEEDASIDMVIFDPPYMAPGGRATSTIDDMNLRYGMHHTPCSPAENADVNGKGIREAARVLKARGILFVKTMDYISSGKFFPGHAITYNQALAFGFTQVDEFIHHSGTGPQPTTNLDGSPRRQVHSRRAHSFLMIFEKR